MLLIFFDDPSHASATNRLPRVCSSLRCVWRTKSKQKFKNIVGRVFNFEQSSGPLTLENSLSRNLGIGVAATNDGNGNRKLVCDEPLWKEIKKQKLIRLDLTGCPNSFFFCQASYPFE